ncbi:MAG: Pantoate kinase [Methanosaeta sp. PtaB.Bin039]|nr:MAG: Pantoate kinase [Methanosaeta sp. PtaB.Bin039]HOT06924.1 pantoate kinase [Methanotrichaceae archaeon]HQF16454.1 pantoate kinase [Methanotrichaceae archaeon]HQI91877.1 pantoate kinase [Methanotrichaceae archaeon]HQJ28434.1 pantoate kinase [Methanotrichaceae archaeon]
MIEPEPKSRIRSAAAFAPGHITGFFLARTNPDPLSAGSMGCGLTLSLGARTVVQISDETQILIDGLPSAAPVSRYVVEALAPSPVRVSTELQMMMGAGFGASGAGALGCAHSINMLFGLGLTCDAAAAVAHRAEVTSGTGLGDVIAQNTGGCVIRLHPGGPGVGKVDRILLPPTRIFCSVRGPISTREILSDPATMRRVNAAGERAIGEMLRRPTWESFLELSYRFTQETELASSWAADAIDAVRSAGGQASMIMLGDSVFAWGPGAEAALSEFGPVIETWVTQGGVFID